MYLDDDQRASGELYVDDGDSLNTYDDGRFTHVVFDFKHGRLNSHVRHAGFDVGQNVATVEIFGLKNVDDVKGVDCNGKPAKFVKDQTVQVKTVSVLNPHFDSVANVINVFLSEFPTVGIPTKI